MPEAQPEDPIKQAVKEAMSERDLKDLSNQMTSLSTQMTAGFSAVHTRQDVTNGKVLKNITDIEKIKSRGNYDRLIWYLFTASIAVITYLLTKGH